MRNAFRAACALLLGLIPVCTGATAQISNDAINIGVLTDIGGPYGDLSGKGSVAAAQMAVDDFGGVVAGKKINVISADHQNKPDVGAAIARRWLDTENIDVIVDVPTSSVALAVHRLVNEKKRIALYGSPAVETLTGAECSPYTVHYVYDTYSLTAATAGSIVSFGGDSWFFITADYAFGHALEKAVADEVVKRKGKVVGAVRHALGTFDYASYLLQAQSSKAKVIGLANAGRDLQSTLKQGAEFGIAEGGQNFAGLLVFITDVHSLGLKATQGLLLTTGFYWDRNEETRAWSKRFYERTGQMPTMIQAGNYSSVRHYLSAIKATGTDDPDAVMAWMKANPVNDFFAKNGRILPNGRFMYDMYLAEVKKPSESTGPWDYYKIRAVIPAQQAVRPLSESACPLVKK